MLSTKWWHVLYYSTVCCCCCVSPTAQLRLSAGVGRTCTLCALQPTTGERPAGRRNAPWVVEFTPPPPPEERASTHTHTQAATLSTPPHVYRCWAGLQALRQGWGGEGFPRGGGTKRGMFSRGGGGGVGLNNIGILQTYAVVRTPNEPPINNTFWTYLDWHTVPKIITGISTLSQKLS